MTGAPTEGLRRANGWASHLFAFFLCNGIAPAQIAMAAGFACFLPSVLRDPRRALGGGRLETSLWLLVALTAVACVRGLDAARSFGADGFVKTCGLMAVYFWIREVCRNEAPRYRHSLLWTFAAGAAVQAVLGIVEYSLWQAGILDRVRIRGTLGLSLSFAELLSLGCLCALSLVSVERAGEAGIPAMFPLRRGRTIFGAVLAALSGAAVLLTFARGAWAGGAAGALVLSGWMRPRARLALAVCAVAACAAFAIVASRSSSPLRLSERVASLPAFAVAAWLAASGSDEAEASRARLDPSAAERIRMWGSGLGILRDHPGGIGLRNLERIYPAYRAPDAVHENEGHLHNNLLQVAVDRGVPGLLAFLLVFGLFFLRAGDALRLARPGRDAAAAGAAAAVVAMFVAGFSEYDFGDSKVAMALWFLMAIGANPVPAGGAGGAGGGR